MTEDIRQKVLDAAVALLGDHGLPALTQPRVAKKAGVRQSHVTYYFPRRADLVGAVGRSYSDSVAAEVLRLIEGTEGKDVGQALRAFATAVIGDRRRTRSLIGLMAAAEEDRALREKMQQGVLGLRAVMAHALGVPETDPAAAMLQATLWGMALQHLLLDQQTDADLKTQIAHTAARFEFAGVRRAKKTRPRRRAA